MKFVSVDKKPRALEISDIFLPNCVAFRLPVQNPVKGGDGVCNIFLARIYIDIAKSPRF
jgi:hypothetical protein